MAKVNKYNNRLVLEQAFQSSENENAKKRKAASQTGSAYAQKMESDWKRGQRRQMLNERKNEVNQRNIDNYEQRRSDFDNQQRQWEMQFNMQNKQNNKRTTLKNKNKGWTK